MLSRRPLLFIHSICKSLHLITLDSQSISTPPSYHDLITVLIQISLGESLRDLSANCLTGRYRKFQGCRGLRSDREESQCRAEAMLPGKFALGAAGGLSETLGDDEEQAPGEREKALGRITITFLCCMAGLMVGEGRKKKSGKTSVVFHVKRQPGSVDPPFADTL